MLDIKNKIILLGFGGTLLLNISWSYGQNPYHELKVGDKLPALEIDSILGHQKMPISSLHQRKLLLINFWATWCVPCVSEMGMLDTLKHKYQNMINVLSVTDDHQKLVYRFLEKHPQIETNTLLISTDSKNLNLLFPHRSIPHNIWIDSTGKVIAITDQSDLNERNIKKYLEGNLPPLIVKHENKKFNWLKPLHVEDSVICYRSIITAYNPELNSGVLSNYFISKRVFAWNIPLSDLFWLAYTKQLSGITNFNMVEIHTKDSLKFFRPKAVPQLFKQSKYYSPETTYKEQYRRYSFDHDFCYELSLPDTVNNEVFSQYIFQDLERYFQISSSIEKRKIKCINITLNERSKLGAHLANPNEQPLIQRLADKIVGKNVKLDQFLLSLSDVFNSTGLPYIDKTGVKSGLDITIYLKDGNISFQEIINQLKNEYGVSFSEPNVEEYPILVLKDHKVKGQF